MKAIYKYDGPLGTYALEEQNGLLTRLWLGDRMALLPGETEISETPLLKEAHRQLTAYFAREQKQFDLPIAPEGTPFQLKIWKLLQEIPYGTTITYGELARRSGDIKASRAVGMANSRNPLPILIPCHRVIGISELLRYFTVVLYIFTFILIKNPKSAIIFVQITKKHIMKHLFLLFLLIPVTLFAQVDKKYLAGAVPVVDDRVVFTEELNLPERSQNDIFATLLQWATTRFITTEELQSRILYSDQDKGQIACMGQEYLVFTNKALSLDRAVINYQMFITCKPGKCELKVTAIRYQYNRGTAGQEIIPAEEQITDQHTLNKTQTKLIKSTGKFRIHTIDLVDKLFADAAAAVGATQVSAPVATQTPAVPRVPVTSTTGQAPDNTITPANLEGYRQISPDKIPGNIYKMLSENWMLITAGNDAQYNMMTASWGGLGHMYNKPVALSTRRGTPIS